MNSFRSIFKEIFAGHITDIDLHPQCSLNNAFMIALSEPDTEKGVKSLELLHNVAESGEHTKTAHFYLEGLQLIETEMNSLCESDPSLKSKLDELCKNIEAGASKKDVCEQTWSIFFPEAVGLTDAPEKAVQELRKKRRVKDLKPNPNPITEPANEIIFTSNALLTVPSSIERLREMPLSDSLKDDIIAAAEEPQLYWYDHPIPLDVAPENNEVLYGLQGLSEAFEFEKKKGNAKPKDKLTCLLSVSVTHEGLKSIAKQYLKEEIERSGGLQNIDVYVFTESDCHKIVKEVLAPSAEHYLDGPAASLDMLGVDGKYGRHYSFLKAIAAFWNILIDPKMKATFKIDLDQVFPQDELVKETGKSAFEHFKTPLWGASGNASDGTAVELGMIAGALVNDKDISKSIYTPDVTMPEAEPKGDEKVFFSRLPQAISTEAEMGTRYGKDNIDGNESCLQRIHVTGGTNGILVDSLRRNKPFTPSFIGRAEDQAYIMSVLFTPGERLAYVHEDGLIMRHDKASFAADAIKSAKIGKTIGDYVRIIYFSEYAKILTHDDVTKLKDVIDPFTGCFVSRIPLTIVYLRFALATAELFQDDPEAEDGIKMVETGSTRITDAIHFAKGESSQLSQCCKHERAGWELFYHILDQLEASLAANNSFANDIKDKAEKIIKICRID